MQRYLAACADELVGAHVIVVHLQYHGEAGQCHRRRYVEREEVLAACPIRALTAVVVRPALALCDLKGRGGGVEL